ncbi:hypothetical protein ACLOJK_024896 [Asimina triloba]
MLAFIIGVALCCCLPCIIAILYTVAGQQGASDAELRILPKFRFRSADRQGKFDLERQHSVVLTIPEPSTGGFLDELSLSPEDSVRMLTQSLSSGSLVNSHPQVILE